MTTLEAIQAQTTAYPLPPQAIEAWALYWGLDTTQEATQKVMQSQTYRLVKADAWDWLATAPNITQGGQSYSFTDEERTLFRQRAQTIRNSVTLEPEEQQEGGTIYGYKGSIL